jgi:hypothetical protein
MWQVHPFRSAKFWAYSASNSDHRMSLAPDRPAVIFCQLSSSGEFKVEGWARSWLNFSVHGSPWCESFDPLYRGFFLHFSTFFMSENPRSRLFFQFIQQDLCKVAQFTIQQQNIQRNKASWTSDTAVILLISGACGYLHHTTHFR